MYPRSTPSAGRATSPSGSADQRIVTRTSAVPVALLLALHRALDHAAQRRHGGDRGQTTAEYALVLLGVAAIALAVVSWATRTNLVSRLLDVVFSALFRKIT
jgi:hypothetical protein